MAFRFSKRSILFIVLVVLVIAVPLTLYLLSQQQDIRQRAVGNADLVVTGLQLTDAGGNVRTVFGVNEDIYVRVRLKNQGTDKGISTDTYTYTQFYANAKDPVVPNTPSDVGIFLKNGEFNPGFEKTYESRWNGLNNSFYKGKIYFSQSVGGTYHARVYINYDGKVAESNLLNNQLDLTYTVTSRFLTNGIYLDGNISSNPPAGFTNVECGEQGTINGVTACYGLGPVNGNGVVKFTNNNTSPMAVGASLHKAYYDFPNPYPSCSPATCPEQFIWIWTQTIYSAQVFTLNPGETRYVTLPAPSCNWQIDAFIGGVNLSFHPPSQTYSQQGRLIGGGWLEQYNGIQACVPDIPNFPSPTPTPTLTPTPTITPTLPPDVPTPTETLTPTPTLTQTPTPTDTPTPTPQPFCPVPSQVQNVRIECPFCGQ